MIIDVARVYENKKITPIYLINFYITTRMVNLIIKKSEKPNSKQDRVFLVNWAEERIKVLKNEKSLLNDKESKVSKLFEKNYNNRPLSHL